MKQTIKNLDALNKLAQKLAGGFKGNEVIGLVGELGAGKTTFVQGLAVGWGSLDAVSSPTFVLVNVYRRADNCQFFHFDTYRVESIGEAEELDIDAMLNSGPLVIEWPERMTSLLPAERLWIELEYVDEDRREFSFLPVGKRYVNLVNVFRKSNFGTE